MRPIGVFDSGVGGLTVVQALQRRLPGESILYLGDTARLPYGTKSPATIARYTRRNLDFLIQRGVKAVIVACNTASALALDDVEIEVPVWDVVTPGAQRAAEVSRGRVGLIATEATVASDTYRHKIQELRPNLNVVSQSCPLLVPLVEEGWHSDPITHEIARRYLEPLIAAGIDTLVLGCTHYPVLKPVISNILGPHVTLVDSAEEVAGLVAEELGAAPGSASSASSALPTSPSIEFFVTDAAARFARIGCEILEASELRLELVEMT